MMFSQGDIIIVPFPFSNLSGLKQRPVLILSNNHDNSMSDDIITCGITSNLKDSKHSVLIDNIDLEEGIIPLKSRIKVDKLFTLEKSIIRKKIAKINKNSLNKVSLEFGKLM